MERYIRLFRKDTLKCLVVDREFVEGDWHDYLNREKIEYHIRRCNNFWVENPRARERTKVSWFFTDLKHSGSKVLYGIYRVNG